MKTAKKMFECLGYYEESPSYREVKRYKKSYGEIIVFYIDKEFMKVGEYAESMDNFNIEELKAINKQVEELGWLE